MNRYIEAEEVEKRIDIVIGSEPKAWDKKALKELKMYVVHAVPTADVVEADKAQKEIDYWHDKAQSYEQTILKLSLNKADVVEVVRCKDCKHRPKKVGNEGNGFDYEFSEEYACPGYCEDGYYAELFDDSFYCAWGER